MNKIQKGKTALITIGVISLVLCVAFAVLGVVLIVGGVNKDPLSVVELVFGIVSVVVAIPCFIIGLYFTWVGAVMKATKGSIKEGNEGKGTMNATLCDKCGSALNGESFCPKCGESTSDKKQCQKCGAENNKDTAYCKDCGEKFD